MHKNSPLRGLAIVSLRQLLDDLPVVTELVWKAVDENSVISLHRYRRNIRVPAAGSALIGYPVRIEAAVLELGDDAG